MAEKERKDQSYLHEEEYFFNLNKDLIERKRKKLDVRRAEQRAKELKASHWMRCPKCGQEMEEVELSGIMVDRCSGCEGVFFDKGELEILLESKEPKGFLGRMECLFK